MIAIVDCGISNIGSVQQAVERIGVETTIADTPQSLCAADAIIMPGVGSFADGMDSLQRYGLVAPIRNAARAGIPILGICLGMQLMAEFGLESGQREGLGLIPGHMERLEPAGSLERVPNIGWCDVSIHSDTSLFQGIADNTAFYFMHSYHLKCTDRSHVAGTISFADGQVCAAVVKSNLYGVQFHPEKSQDHGLQLLNNFVRLIERKGGEM